MMSVFVETTVGLGHAASSNWKVEFIFLFTSALSQHLEDQIVAEESPMGPLSEPPLNMKPLTGGRIHPITFDLHVQVITVCSCVTLYI
jgi:hypothetical protein